MRGIGNYRTGYTYKTKELGDVSLFVPLLIFTGIIGIGGYMVYRRDASDDEYEDDDEISSGKESIRAVDKAIRQMRSNPDY